MNLDQLRWYAHRLSAMSASEVSWRVRDHAQRIAGRRQQVAPGHVPALPATTHPDRSFDAVLPAGFDARIVGDARDSLVRAADRLLSGEWTFLGIDRSDMTSPDWFRDPSTGIRSDPGRYVFDVDYKDEASTGNAKQVWEVSRHQHLTVLAAAWYLTRDDAYALAVADQLRSWWRANPYLSGVNWACGIEVGIRLISWTWIRRLLDEWPKAADLFEHNVEAVQQIHWHQKYLARFRSRGSSANNHVIAEAAGALVGGCAFAWFEESERWCDSAARLLETELRLNTFDSGINRELAFDYQAFVAELGMLAAVEAQAAHRPVSDGCWDLLARMLDATASVVDVRLRPPRQGDGDDGRGLIVDSPEVDRWAVLLDTGAAVCGPLEWWPTAPRTVQGSLLAALAEAHRPANGRPTRRSDVLPDAGMTLLRTPSGSGPELWCRCDGGPHGFLSIAAHAHADALSIEVRCDGVDVLADPGTYCYHGEPAWRSYFRSTIGHNTLELAGRDQSVSAGPFLWRSHAQARTLPPSADRAGLSWVAEHDGYTSLNPPAVHRRSVTLDPDVLVLTITDRVDSDGACPARLAFHLGPTISASLDEGVAVLQWNSEGVPYTAVLTLPAELSWTAHTGQTQPPLGWYSPRFGVKVPATTLVGCGTLAAGVTELTTTLRLSDLRPLTTTPIGTPQAYQR